MGIRGKQSTAGLSVIQAGELQRPKPPRGMPKDQARVWRDVVATKPADWWKEDSLPLLEAYVAAVVFRRGIADAIAQLTATDLMSEDGVRRADKLSNIHARASVEIANLATKMRLTQQSRYKAQTAATADAKAGGAAKPWQRSSNVS